MMAALAFFLPAFMMPFVDFLMVHQLLPQQPFMN